MSNVTWPQLALRYVADLNPRVPSRIREQTDDELPFLPMEAIAEGGGFDASRTRPVREVLAGYSYFENGDIAYAKVTPCFENGKAALFSGLQGEAGFGTTEITVVRPKPSVDGNFLFYILREHRFQQLGQSEMTGAGGLKRVPESFAKRYAFPLPSLEEQRAIASFLDHETTEIDAFIADQGELIRLLNERRASVVNQAVAPPHGNTVTPADLNLVRFGQSFKESDQRAQSAVSNDLLSVSIHSGVVPWSDLHDKEPRAADLSNYKVVHMGDLVLNRMRAFQGGLGEANQNGVVSPDYMVMRVHKQSSSSYLAYLMKSHWFVSEMTARLRGIGTEEQGNARTPRINPRDLANIRVPSRTSAEQKQIVDYLDHETAEIDASIADAKEAIVLSKERRAALISAAVTGKIDVRDHPAAKGAA